VAQRPSVRWNESKQRWMAWVRFPDGSRRKVERVETVFQAIADNGYATSTIDHTWSYLNQACQFALRRRKIKTNPVADVLLPTARPPRQRKSFTIEQVQALLTVAIPKDPRPAL
jgi:site-specific recombinase XerD